MELGPDNHTCQIQSYCAKHLKCSQKCDQNKFSVKCSCYEGWVLEPDGESCRSLGERQSRSRRGEQGGGARGVAEGSGAAAELQGQAEVSIWAQCQGPRRPCLRLDRVARGQEVTPSHPSLDPFKPFIIFSNRHEIRRIDLHKGDYSVLVPGLRNTIALDFHLSQSALYWTDVVEDKIYRGKLLDNGGDPRLPLDRRRRGAPVHPRPGPWAFRSTGPDADCLEQRPQVPLSPTLLLIGLDFAVGLSV